MRRSLDGLRIVIASDLTTRRFRVTAKVSVPAVSNLSEFEKKAKKRHPSGFEPGLQWDGSKGTITTGPLENEPDESVWALLIEDWGLDPDRTQVVDGSLQIRAWDAGDGEGGIRRMKYYRASIEPRSRSVDRADIDALCRLVEKKKPIAPKNGHDESAFLVLLSDFQLGKSEGGGSSETTNRILRAADSAVQRLKDLQKTGRMPKWIYLVGLGDLVEGCAQFYAMQTFQADLSDREQDRLARRLILHFIDSFLEFGLPIVAMGVPGNHGENRKGGKAFTNWLDNRDYAAFETVSEIIASNPDRYGNVSIPLNALNDDDLTMTLDLAGVPVAFAHGHQFRSGANSQAKMEGWWKSQAMGRTGVADASILCAGHLHHFVLSEGTGRTVIQVPAMDGGSKWFTATAGSSSPAGMVTLLVGSGVGIRGWGDLLIV
jgi:hypothetical protein